MTNGQALPRTDSISNVSWRAIFAGTSITLVTMMMLVLLGMAIGLFAVNPATEQNPFGGLGIGTTIWWILSWIISLFIGGWVTSRFAGMQRKWDGALHGLVTWSLTFIISMVFLANLLGAVVGGTFNLMQNTLRMAGQFMSAVAPGMAEMMTGQDPMQAIMQEGQQIMEQIRQRGGEDAVAELTNTIRQVFQQPEITPQDKQKITGILTQYTDMSEQEAESTVDRWVNTYQQARQQVQQFGEQVTQRAEQITDALAQAAIWSFFALLLGAIAAAAGGMVGRVKGVVTV
ncbi:MAG: hypothetical protein R2940_18425 [Syntrophotaleaceae bacterium]